MHLPVEKPFGSFTLTVKTKKPQPSPDPTPTVTNPPVPSQDPTVIDKETSTHVTGIQDSSMVYAGIVALALMAWMVLHRMLKTKF